MLSIILAGIVIIVSIILAVLHYRRIQLERTELKNFSGVPGLPIVGHIFDSISYDNEDFIKVFMNVFDEVKHTPVYGWVGTVLMVGFDLPEDFQVVLNSEVTLKKAFVYDFMNISLGIFSAEPKKWKEHRRLLNPAMSQKMVTTFIPIFNDVFKTMTDQMNEFVGGDIDMYSVMFKAASDLIVQASFGLKWSLQSDRGNDLVTALIGWLGCVQQRMIRFWLKPDFVYSLTPASRRHQNHLNHLRSFLSAAYEAKVIDVAEKKMHGIDEIGDARESNSMNYMQKCIQFRTENKFSALELDDELLTIFTGSTDTSSIVIKAITLMLAIHTDYQERVVDELREIFENPDDPITADDLAKMTFLELIVKESLRLFPIAPLTARENTDKFIIRDAVIPKGTILVLNVYKMHRNPKVWGENASKFYPERFLPENFENMHPYAYVPFSAGPRNCIGWRYAMVSLKMAVAYILRRYKMTSQLKYEDIRIETSVILKICNKNSVQLERREWKKSKVQS